VSGTVREFRFWKVGSWEPGLRIAKDQTGDSPGQLAFSRDGTLLAIQDSWNRVKLIDPRTSAELASLDTPWLEIPAPLCFSADASRLILGDRRKQIHVWDVRLTRARLAEMRLDWNLPPFPPPRLLASEGQLDGRVVIDATEIRSFHGQTRGEPNGVS